jgi:hypothetical protein
MPTAREKHRLMRQMAEPNSDMIPMLELSDQQHKVTIIDNISVLMEKIGCVQEEVGKNHFQSCLNGKEEFFS